MWRWCGLARARSKLAHARLCVRLPAVAGRSARSTRSNSSGMRNFLILLRCARRFWRAMNASSARVGDLARLNFLLGELYADAVLATQRQFRVKADLVGCHGQTLYHQGESRMFLGRKVAATWQTGEGAVVAARVGVPVVSDFRPADMAAGGKGAPLVPYLDYLLFRDPKIGRIVQNVGGIANLTAIPAGGGASDVFAFDTGPGNMVIDAVTEALYGRAFDRGGKIAASGTAIDSVLDGMLQAQVFSGEASEDRGARGVWARICTRVLAAVWAVSQGRRGRNGHGADGAVDCGRGAAIRGSEIECGEKYVSRNDSFRGRCRGTRRWLRCSRSASHLWACNCDSPTSSACLQRPKKRWRSRCWLTKLGTGGLRMCLRATGAKRAAVLGKISYA